MWVRSKVRWQLSPRTAKKVCHYWDPQVSLQASGVKGGLVMFSRFSHVWPSATPWTVAHQAPLSMRFPRQEDWSELPFPSLGDIPNPGIEPASPVSLSLAGGWFTECHLGNPVFFNHGHCYHVAVAFIALTACFCGATWPLGDCLFNQWSHWCPNHIVRIAHTA